MLYPTLTHQGEIVICVPLFIVNQLPDLHRRWGVSGYHHRGRFLNISSNATREGYLYREARDTCGAIVRTDADYGLPKKMNGNPRDRIKLAALAHILTPLATLIYPVLRSLAAVYFDGWQFVG